MLHYKPLEIVYNPHTLTPKALKMAQGLVVPNPSDEDLDSLLDWMERKEKLQSVWQWIDAQQLQFNF
jgi:hypothetical protein